MRRRACAAFPVERRVAIGTGESKRAPLFESKLDIAESDLECGVRAVVAEQCIRKIVGEIVGGTAPADALIATSEASSIDDDRARAGALDNDTRHATPERNAPRPQAQEALPEIWPDRKARRYCDR